jgi:hypothetical protein
MELVATQANALKVLFIYDQPADSETFITKYGHMYLLPLCFPSF